MREEGGEKRGEYGSEQRRGDEGIGPDRRVEERRERKEWKR